MISYYELLGMIKEDKAPNKIRVHLNSQPRIYKKDDDTEEYCYYVLENEKEENENYQYYLMESYLESMIFDETIEILEEDKKIEKMSKFYTEHINENGVYFSSENDELQEKIDKAIEYIKCGKTFDDIETARIIDKYEKILLEILQGSDKE